MENQKPYKLGVVCGRFSHEHLGHISLFDKALSLCDQTLILVGSAQEFGTLRNPFKVETRIDVIKQTYPNKSDKELIIHGINDLTNEYDVTCEWGKYVKSEVERHMNSFADLIIYGNDELRNKWFSEEDLKETKDLVVSRDSIQVSATEVRGILLINDKENWKKATHPLIHNMYEKLREELMNVEVYKEIHEQLCKTEMSLEKFKEIYKELEKKDKEMKIAKIKK